MHNIFNDSFIFSAKLTILTWLFYISFPVSLQPHSGVYINAKGQISSSISADRRYEHTRELLSSSFAFVDINCTSDLTLIDEYKEISVIF